MPNPLSSHPDLLAQWGENPGLDPHQVGNGATVNWNCPAGHSYPMLVGLRVNRGLSCPHCSGRRVLAGFNDVATTDPDLLPRIAPGNLLDPTTVTRASSRKMLLTCDREHVYEQSVKGAVVLGRGCPLCSNHRKVKGVNDLATLFPEIAQEYDPDNPIPLDDIWGTPRDEYRTKVAWICRRDPSHRWEHSLHRRIADGALDNCPYCRGVLPIPGKTDAATLYPDLVSQWHGDNPGSLSDYLPSSCVRADWTCDRGHTWNSLIFHRTVDRSRCPICHPQSSAGEEDMAEFLGRHVPRDQMVRNDRTILAGRELDIWFPDHNLAVEYNGLYWHSETAGRGKWYHHGKWADCRRKGIQLVQVWEDEWAHHRPAVEAMLLAKLGISPARAVGARQCTTATLDNTTAREFCDRNHIQGATGASIRLGLFHGGEMVAVALLARSGHSGHTAVLHRYCTSPDTRVVGGCGKLLAAAARGNPWLRQVETFSDHRVSDGGMYGALDFQTVGDLALDYGYLWGGERKHKFSFRRGRFERDPDLLWNPDLSESELARLNGIPRLWDAGKTKHLWTVPGR